MWSSVELLTPETFMKGHRNTSVNKILNWSLTEHRQAFVQHVVEGPDVGGPVGMTEAPLKGEETGQDLRELTLKRTLLHQVSVT